MVFEPGVNGAEKVSAIEVAWYQKIDNSVVPADKAISREITEDYNLTLVDPDRVAGNESSHAVNFYNDLSIEKVDVSLEDFFHNNSGAEDYAEHSVTIGCWLSGNYYAFL